MKPLSIGTICVNWSDLLPIGSLGKAKTRAKKCEDMFLASRVAPRGIPSPGNPGERSNLSLPVPRGIFHFPTRGKHRQDYRFLAEV